MKYPTFSLEKCEHFVKSSGRNRCALATAQGWQLLSIPVLGGRSQQTLISEVQLANEKPWQRQHWHAIKTAYGKAPYFEDYSPFFEPFFFRPYDKLWDFNSDLLSLCFRLLGLQKSLGITTLYAKEVASPFLDFRDVKYFSLREQTPYYQGFSAQIGFLPDLSILDLLFHLGPQSKVYLERSLHLVESA